MRLILKANILLMAGVIFFASCKKYEEGPTISLRSKKERIANTWKVNKATLDDGADSTSYYSKWVILFTKEGTFMYSNGQNSLATWGTWDLINDKTVIAAQWRDFNIFSPTYNKIITFNYKILKLKVNEVCVHLDEQNMELQLIPKY